MKKPSVPQGMRDFSPNQMLKRQWLFDSIKKVFIKYGFLPLETPTMENLSSLTGKYGDEGDQLLFRVLNSGDFLKDVRKKDAQKKVEELDYKEITTKVSKRGLRYDLTVPFARYVVQHQSEITFPFRRFQIQPVWRADRPQKGRYREFYQCDADVVGSDSLINEAELLQMADEVFEKLNLKVTIKLNSRKILQGLSEVVGFAEKMTDITVAIDKLDKIGWEGVSKELSERELSEEAISKIKQFIESTTSVDTSFNNEKLEYLKEFFTGNAVGEAGIIELEQVQQFLQGIPFVNNLEIDPTLARGLGYYTGCIYEIKAEEAEMGSIGGGGRYDDLTGIFGLKGYSGVGISFGIERIYDVLEELDLFPEEISTSTKVIFLAFDESARIWSLPLVRRLRDRNISTEVYTENKNIKKQFDYANKRNIPFCVVVGENEMKTGKLAVKNMIEGSQELMSIDELIEKFA
ncbi:histidine--tRNA ligase [Bernardetia sp.]|uniref:histidine--tRNA ligase n=1 Tax=Bernardetia sp. TaxID=1937974 RepID=UPI0025C2F8AF|nr:histidine--tRNA ligase [Bernardetia sp.]